MSVALPTDDRVALGGTFAGAYSGKRVLVTGDTGFKGSWLCEWLLALGADVVGFGLGAPTNPALHEQLGLAARVAHVDGDVRDADAVRRAVVSAQPDFVFHLAAQALVRRSYAEPVETFATNVMGTVNVLEALRHLDRPCAAVMVTTDKCYENREWVHGYREEDPLGGYDPYSSSKAAAEIAIAAYRRSFFQRDRSQVRVASARAGNVIGGGDWAEDRLVPDCIRALERQQAIAVRNKIATRPWQHVLEPLSGYLWLGARLAAADGNTERRSLESAFNFGPSAAANRSVAELVQVILRHWPGRWEDRSDPSAVHEAGRLSLATDKAHHVLGWAPVWSFEEAVAETIRWYRMHVTARADIATLTRAQIEDYTAAAIGQGLPWALVNHER